jgi:predicted AlkP superfamily phosphohydrolase/phosphomutase
LIAIVTLIVVIRNGRNGRGGTTTGTGAVPETVTFTDLSGCFESERWKRSSSRPVVFIGIDAASWEFLGPLIDRNLLPNLARIKREGAHATLRSIDCYVSPPAWATMLSGYLPKKTGVYSFGKWEPTGQEFASVNADDVEVPRVWEIASYSGKMVGVFNVPMSYPPRPVNGVIVSGMMTPVERAEPTVGKPVPGRNRDGQPVAEPARSYSPVRRTATGDSLNTYLWSLHDTVDDGIKDYDTVSLTVVARTGADAVGHTASQSYTFRVGDFSPWVRIQSMRGDEVDDAWCRVAIVKTPDGEYDTRISPAFFAIAAQYAYPDTMADHLENTFGFYTPGVFVGAELVPSMTEMAASHASYFYDLDDWDLYLYVFTQSDNIHHLTGFSAAAIDVYRRIDRLVGDIMDRMPEDGTLIIASDHGFGRYTHGLDLNWFLGDLGLLVRHEDNTIDHDRSLVFHHIWHLYFNDERITREELARRGIVVSASENPVDFLVSYLQQAVKTIRSTDGMTVSLELRRLPGDAAGDVPDMAVKGTYGEVVVDFLGLETPRSTVIRGLEGNERGWHTREGVFMAWGRDIRRGYDTGSMNIQDVAPTILYLLGLPVAADMDGRVMSDIFERRLLVEKALYRVDDYAEISREPSDTDRESLADKLRSLGYIR